MRGMLASEASGFVVANACRRPTTMSFSFLDVFGFRFAYAIAGKAAAGVVVAGSVFRAGDGGAFAADVGSCARAGAYGCRGLACGRAPAGSGRFRRKWAPILPWVPGFCAVFGGAVRCRLRRPGETPACCGGSGRFGLRNRPEVASGARWLQGAWRTCGSFLVFIRLI